MKPSVRLTSTPRHRSGHSLTCLDLMSFLTYLADKDATDYLRGIIAVGEHSERVLELTEHIIRLNPAHYTVWCVANILR